jgi:anaerobic selenocysteine-containing dehydrogenase
MIGLDALAGAVEAWTPERQAAVTGIAAETLRELVRAHHASGAAALYLSTGVNQGRSGALCFWFQEAINAISGNLDRRGGSLMGSSGLVDFAAEGKQTGAMGRRVWRKDGLPSIVGGYPSAMFADDVLSGPEPRPRALFVEAANPLLVAPDPRGHLREALEALELLVSIDLFRNETGNLAHYILPATTFLERADVPYALQSMAGNMPVPYITYADAVLEPPPGVRPEWWIWIQLAEAANVTLFRKRLAHRALVWNARASRVSGLRRLAITPDNLISGMLKKAGLPDAKKMRRDHPHGMLLAPNRPGSFLGTERVLTGDHKVQLAPAELVAAARGLEARHAEELARRSQLKLISKRELRSLNSWMRNNPELAGPATNYLFVHPEDAARLGLRNGSEAWVRSAVDAVRAPVQISDEVMPGTVALPFGWGHAEADGLPEARKRAGVNVNRLAPDGRDAIDPLSGMAFLSGIPVEVSAAQPSQSGRKSGDALAFASSAELS